MFEVFGKPAPNTLWGVWALWIKAGPRVPNNKDAIYRNCVFIPRWRPLGAMGVEESPNSNNFQMGEVNIIKETQKSQKIRSLKALDLFSGTGSVSRALKNLGFEVVSVDLNPRCEATHNVDIMQWNYKSYPTGYFDIIFACPPCTQYSVAKTMGNRDLFGADKIINKTLDIIKYFKPSKWFLENP